jgi:hypothetical protein
MLFYNDEKMEGFNIETLKMLKGIDRIAYRDQYIKQLNEQRINDRLKIKFPLRKEQNSLYSKIT